MFLRGYVGWDILVPRVFFGGPAELTGVSGTGVEVVPNLPKCRVRVSSSYRTLPEGSVHKAAPNTPVRFGRGVYRATSPAIALIRTRPNIALMFYVHEQPEIRVTVGLPVSWGSTVP